MSEYIPRIYWPARLAREGTKFVGRSGMDDAASERQAKQFLTHILPHIPDDCIGLLDFGCGVGRLSPRLAAATKYYSGADICDEALALAPDLPNGEYIHLYQDRIQPHDGTYNCIVAVTVLQHIVAPDQFKLWTSELNRVAASGCTFLVIDNHLEGDGSAHVRARTALVLAEALGIEIVSSKVISVEKKDSHFFMVGRKS